MQLHLVRGKGTDYFSYQSAFETKSTEKKNVALKILKKLIVFDHINHLKHVNRI